MRFYNGSHRHWCGSIVTRRRCTSVSSTPRARFSSQHDDPARENKEKRQTVNHVPGRSELRPTLEKRSEKTCNFSYLLAKAQYRV